MASGDFARRRTEQRELIVASARSLAERQGWDAVTTRRLSTEVGFSQPVIYKHFASMDHLVEAVAVHGFGQLADALHEARPRAEHGTSLLAAARAYVAFAASHRASYEAMFARADLRFGETAAPPLRRAFAELRAAVEPTAGRRDLDTLTEVVWSALHGLVTLADRGRLRPDHETDRVRMLVASLA